MVQSRLVFQWTSIPCILIAVAACASTGMTPALRRDLELKMHAAESPIIACYEQALETNPDLHGKMTLKFKIRENTNALSNLQIGASELKHPGVEECVTRAASAIRLARATESEIDGAYPLEFSRGSGGAKTTTAATTLSASTH